MAIPMEHGKCTGTAVQGSYSLIHVKTKMRERNFLNTERKRSLENISNGEKGHRCTNC